ncbi:hypothetical protein A2W14_00270 [Candidatus Gottesmanbacteria bacterium RBG_16_37_8]|uniref:Mur ligase central domain-containing protein n=1 Tax=Candidatus Gottesmanbacteria bacterium RBG_16_37_8 TaxID=1798371 RepID=A0A1F5YS77_9BACT|nr:MAG: hypothetical protein A2W14_00270 [Candidatus Gottesmanbacteria bacterium RBG_16_37_8]
MLYSLSFILIVAFIVRTIRLTFYHTYLWQLKEYRLDRYWIFLKSPLGKKLLLHPLNLLKWILLIIIYGASLFNILSKREVLLFPVIIYAFYIFWAVWLLELILGIKDIFLKRWRIPEITTKSLLIIVSVLLIQFSSMINIFWMAPLLLGPILDKILAPCVAIVVQVLNIPVYFIKKYIYYKAKVKLRRMLKTEVIGITGSFGKTSVKMFLAQILSSKYLVSHTPGSFNTEIAIARHIMRLPFNADFFIVEMGAYKKGEIKNICRLVNPHIALITGLGSQHLELFGSQQNLFNAKFELIENLPRNGLAVINRHNSRMNTFIDKTEKIIKKVLVVDKTKMVRNLKVYKSFLQFELKIGTRIHKFRANLAGEQNVENLILAIITAHQLNVSIEDIKKSVLKLNPCRQTMQIVKSGRKLTLIDDTFNVNFEAVRAALNYLKLYNGLRVLFLNPLIELGDKNSSLHEEIGTLSGDVCHYLITTNMNSFKNLSLGISKSDNKLTKLIPAGKNVVEKIQKDLKENSVILFSGKESSKWIPYFKDF